ncbi:cupin domain-containing protein [Streptomyces sp. 3212.3]|uniref:cupin domain-containing protein n=1 Tax=Streptomyces sp. 3212.3 TaxID=1938846 RepID=UPI0026C9C9A3|nr:cupin domain-containing protein [Streptomyces sp. 3212.3]
MYDQQVRTDGRQASLGHAGTEHTIVQSGQLDVEVDGHLTRLGPGDYIAFDASIPHGYAAPEGPVRSVLLLQYRTPRPRQDDDESAANAPH